MRRIPATNNKVQSVVSSLLNIELEASQTTVNTPVNINVSVVTDQNVVITEVNETYYVPIIRVSDNMQVDFLQVDLVNGQGSFVFTPSSKGIFSVAMDKIRPIPTAKLQNIPEILVL